MVLVRLDDSQVDLSIARCTSVTPLGARVTFLDPPEAATAPKDVRFLSWFSVVEFTLTVMTFAPSSGGVP